MIPVVVNYEVAVSDTFLFYSYYWEWAHTKTNLQKTNITQYVQHSHFSKTKKDRDTDALQWTASAECVISQVKKKPLEKVNMHWPADNKYPPVDVTLPLLK